MATKTEDAKVEGIREQLQQAADAQALYAVGRLIADMGLPEETLAELRQVFTDRLVALRKTVKAEVLNGKVVTLLRPRYVETRIGPSFYLTGTFEDGKDFECWAPGSANGPVHRFLERRPVTAYPVKVLFHLDPHPTDSGKTMWSVDLVPDAPQAGLPF